MQQGLYIIATPIGNLGDITLRALETLKSVTLIACEDTRTSGKLLKHYDIKTPTFSYHDHNADIARPKLIEKIKSGQSIALISDAGTPLISDPGFKLVRDCHTQNLSVFSIPGACSVIAGLSIAGLPTDEFSFLGFLPAKQAALISLLQKNHPGTLIAFESPNRLGKTLKIIADLWPDRRISIAREITKLYEQTIIGTASELAQKINQHPVKGEIVLLIEPATPETLKLPSDMAEIIAILAQYMKTKEISELLAKLYDVPKKQAYEWVLAQQK